MDLSIIAPAHNEEEIIGSFIDNAVRYLRKNKIFGEVVVVENGSRDKTGEILKKLKIKYGELVIDNLPVGNKGLALKRGMEMAKGEYLITMDTDLWDEKFVERSIKNLEKYDVVVGSKSIPGAKDERSLLSRLFNIGYNFTFRLIFNFQGTETHALLSFRREKILPLVRQCKTSELVFDTELILRAERAKLTKIEIPATVKEVRARRYSMVKQLIRTVQNSLKLGWVLGISPNWNYVVVFAALVLGAFLRFYNFHQWFFFSVDEEHYSYMTRMITVDHHFPLIGGPISGTKLYMAPWFLYFNAIWFLLSSNDPVFSGMVFTALELGVVIFIYILGKRLVGPKAAAIGALLYAGSFLMALFDRHYWNITLTPLISISSIYFLVRWLEDKGRKWLILAALIISFGISSTFSPFVVLLFAVIAIFWFGKKDLPLFLAIIVIMHLPLVWFDLRHDHWMLRAIWEFITVRSYDSAPLIQRIIETLTLFGQTLGKALVITSSLNVSDETSICFVGGNHYVAQTWAVFAGLIGLAGIFLAKRKALVGLLLFVNIFSLLLFRADPGERHFLPFLPFFFIFTGAVLARLPKVLTLLILVLLLAVNFYSFINSYASAGIAHKESVVKSIISRTNAGEFYFDSVGQCHKWGYRYLFSEFNHEPAASFMDNDFSWMYSQPPNLAAVKTYETIQN